MDKRTMQARVRETIYPNGQGAITAQEHQDLLLDMVDEIYKKTEEAVEPDGTYPNMSVGKADDLSGHGESVPAEFTFRATGGKSIKDGSATIKEMEGNAVVWNQKVDKVYVDGDKILVIREGVSMISGHKYLLNRSVAKKECYVIVTEDFYDYSIYEGQHSKIFTNAYDCVSNGVYPSQPHIYCTGESGYVQLIDLTLMYGAGNEPTTLEEYEARKPIVADEYAYNEGEVIAFNGEAVKSVGDNALDDSRDNFITDYDYNTAGDYSFMNEQDVYVGATRNGYAYWWNVEDYSKSGNGYSFRPTGGGYGLGMMVRALPNEEYSITWKSDKGQVSIGLYDSNKKVIDHIANTNTFVTPSNCEYILLVLCALDNHIGEQVVINDIMLTLVHSGWKVDTDAGYQPYWEDTLQIDSRIREAFPNGMHKWDKVYNKDGKGYIVKGTGVVDLGTLEWGSADDNHFFASHVLGNCGFGNLLCAKYTIGTGQFSNMEDKTIGNNAEKPYNEFLFVRDDAYTDTASFKAAMAGVMLYYELAEPTIIEYDKPFKLDYKVADFGTEELISAQPSAPFKARTIYQFNAVDQIRENYNEIQQLKAMLTTLQASINNINQ